MRLRVCTCVYPQGCLCRTVDIFGQSPSGFSDIAMVLKLHADYGGSTSPRIYRDIGSELETATDFDHQAHDDHQPVRGTLGGVPDALFGRVVALRPRADCGIPVL